MKKSIVVVILVSFSFASCKKERNCVCNSNFGTTQTTSIKASKKKARKECRSNSFEEKGIIMTCELED